MASYKVGILGATGAVGEQMRIVLAERKFPISELRLFRHCRAGHAGQFWIKTEIILESNSCKCF